MEETKAPTAEDLEKVDIIIRWAELKNAIGALEKILICREGNIKLIFAHFTEKFYAFFFATQFYVSEEARKEVENLFEELEKGKVDPFKAIKTAKNYVWECYKRGMFLEEEVIGEEG